MAILAKAPRGTQDILPGESSKWNYVEGIMAEEARTFGYREIRTPVFEHTELFVRSVGDTTDVVQKEMYTFEDKGHRSVTLKPEGTAGAVRALIESGMLHEALPVKTFYITPCFRYEKPQAGRLREFHQFGVEAFGSSSPIIDAEVISLAKAILDRLGVTELSLELNSIGCPSCRAEYHKALRAYLEERKELLCQTCLGRLEKNPMRILDCKNPECAEIAQKAPRMLEYLCPDCQDHFDGVKKALDKMQIAYSINPSIVRGLDYYTRTVFEFVSTAIGAQATVCGGGRYDGLVKELGGDDLPALGFGMGLERLLLLMENTGCSFQPEPRCHIYVGSMGEVASLEAVRIVEELRRNGGLHAECDLMERSVKAQMKYAGKIGAKFSMMLGDNELLTGKVRVKNMDSGEEKEIELNDLEGLADYIQQQ